MRHKNRTIFAALVAVLALGVVASASASAALPEFAPGSGEKLPIAVEFSGARATSYMENTGGSRFPECEGLKAKGEITGAKALSLTVETEKCKDEGLTCTTKGAAEGHEVLSGAGTLVYIDKATKQVGIDLTLKEATVWCGEVAVKVKGAITVPVGPINGKTSVVDLKIKGAGKGKQEITSYENEKGEKETTTFFTNFGSGYLESNLTVSEELKLATNKPVTISG